MERFRAGGLDVLVATTVIEVGVDVPSRRRWKQRPEDPRPRGAERVPDGDRAAVRVDDLGVELGHSARQASDCAANASLSSTTSRSSQPIPARSSAVGRLDRRDAEHVGVDAGGAAAGDPGERLARRASRAGARRRAAARRRRR